MVHLVQWNAILCKVYKEWMALGFEFENPPTLLGVSSMPTIKLTNLFCYRLNSYHGFQFTQLVKFLIVK